MKRILLFAILFIFNNSTGFSQCDSLEQRNALMDLYHKAGGDHWARNDNWGSDKAFDEWFGITTDENGCVKEIRLPSDGLAGTLSPKIGDFSELLVISIPFNPDLKNELPKEIGKLKKLMFLSIDRCGFSGTLPIEIGNLDQLLEFHAYHNHFSQNLPTEFGNLVELNVLDLSYNRITSIPESFSNLKQLKNINFSNNGMKGNDVLNILSNLTNLELLDLRGNLISGQIPNRLISNTNLNTLWLTGNRLSGCLTDSLISKFCDNIFRINLDGNPLLPYNGNLESICFHKNQIGAPCDDLDKFTKNDQIRDNCECKGDLDTTDCKITNYLSLMKIYNALDGDNWTNHESWGNKNVSLKYWHGIRTNSDGCVTHIDLGNNNLSGKIPKEIGQLKQLKEIRLFSNKLSGNIPVEISNLKKITFLRIDKNQFSGNIPIQLTQLSKLKHLNLKENEFSCPIPKEFGNMTQLKTLLLNNNNFIGKIPPEIGLLSDLTNLNLSYNALIGEIPKELGNIDYLDYLDLSHNQLTGTIPSSLTKLPMEKLALNDNQLSGEIPVGFGSYFYFHGLYFQNNNLSGCFPDLLEKFQCEFGFDTIQDQNSHGYNFTNNPLLPYKGDFQKICKGMPQKSAPCDDGDPNTDGDAIDKDCNCSPSNGCHSRDLAALLQIYTNTNGKNWKENRNWGSSKYIGEWHGVYTNQEGCVVRLDLTNNLLKGKIPDAFGDLSDLIGLVLAENELEGEIPRSLKNLESLKYLNLSNNQLTHNIPFEIGEIKSLKGLNLSHNKLSGNIPKELGELLNLNSILLYNNQLEGEIPMEIYQLKELNELSLQNNQLEGEIPKEISQLSNLIWLDLSNNQLEGKIPSELAECKKLEDIRLSNNQITGNIPEKIGSLENLNWLYLNNNNFYNCIPNNIIKGKCEDDLQFRLGNNPLLPFQGDLSKLCSDVTQIGALCNDGDSSTPNDKIDEYCLCNGKTVASYDIEDKAIITIVPNPATDYLNFEIKHKNWLGNTNIVFYNLLGEEIRKLVISDASNVLDYRVDIPSGVYFCRVENQVFKIVIARN